MRIRPDAGVVLPRLLFETLGRSDVMGVIAGRAQGAIMPNLNLDILSDVAIVLPPLQLQHAFIDFVAPIDAQVGTLTAQNARLKNGRDLLLPRLMSGEIALRESASD